MTWDILLYFSSVNAKRCLHGLCCGMDGAATGYTGDMYPTFLAGWYKGYIIDLDKYSVYQFSPVQSSCIHTSMAVVFPFYTSVLQQFCQL